VKFTSYASWWIRAYMLRFILNNLRMVKLGTTHAQRKLFFNLNKEKERLERMGIVPEHALLAKQLDVREGEVAEMERRLGSSDVSLDAPVSRDDESRSRIDMMPGTMPPPDEQVARGEFDRMLRRTLADFASSLAKRDRELFERRWLTDDPETLQEVGARFGISRERTRQIEKRMLRRLRSVLEARLGTDVSIAAYNPADAIAA
jgi:RNA polymerase sigma-32 factor